MADPKALSLLRWQLVVILILGLLLAVKLAEGANADHRISDLYAVDRIMLDPNTPGINEGDRLRFIHELFPEFRNLSLDQCHAILEGRAQGLGFRLSEGK
jgi:hypothetical protein